MRYVVDNAPTADANAQGAEFLPLIDMYDAFGCVDRWEAARQEWLDGGKDD